LGDGCWVLSLYKTILLEEIMVLPEFGVINT